MQETVKKYSWPFNRMPDGKIGEGLHSDVFSLGSEWVVKRIKPAWQRGDWKERLTRDFRLLDYYLGPFIPSTTLVACTDGTISPKTKTPKSDLVIVQRRVDGKSLRDLSWAELLDNDETIGNIIELGKCVKQMYAETHMTPDLHGGTRNFLRQYDFKYSNNLLISAEGQVWWTDVDRLGPFWSPDWIGGRVHMALMIRAFSAFIHRLQKRTVSTYPTPGVG